MSFGELKRRPRQESTTVSRSPVAVSSALIRPSLASVPCSQTSRRPSRLERHAVRRVRVLADGLDLRRPEREPFDVHLGPARQRREVEGVLVGDVDRPLVGVDIDDPSELRRVAEHVGERRIPGSEGRVAHADAPTST